MRRTVDVRQCDLAFGRIFLRTDHHRPEKRTECPEWRPCPYVGCRYNLYLDVARNGRLIMNYPMKNLEDIPETCVLDVADRGAHTLEDIANILGLSKESVRQIEQKALRKAYQYMESRGDT